MRNRSEDEFPRAGSPGGAQPGLSRADPEPSPALRAGEELPDLVRLGVGQVPSGKQTAITKTSC